MQLYSKVSCHPPLGRTTIVPSEQQTFELSILLKSGDLTSKINPAVIVRFGQHGKSSDSWNEVCCERVDTVQGCASLGHGRLYSSFQSAFRTTVPCSAPGQPCHFTFKYRLAETDPWQWANETLRKSDAEVLRQVYELPTNFKDLFEGCDSNIAVKEVRSEAESSRLWALSASVRAAQGRESSWTRLSLGVPRYFSRWFAIVKAALPWIAPRHGKAPFGPSDRSILTAFSRKDGTYLVCLAISTIKDVTTLFVTGDRHDVVANCRNDRQRPGDAFFLVAVGTDFNSTIAATMYQARRIASNFSPRQVHTDSGTELSQQQGPRTIWFEDWYDRLGYCTWNGLGKNLTEEKILDALADLKAAKISVSNLIIDDNWQSLDKHAGWLEFEANKDRFPNGLKGLTARVRRDNPDIRHIAVWHAILGYWGALSPHGEIAKKYKTTSVKKMDGSSFHVVDEPDIDRMYDDFYRFLLASGIDAVKTDDQCMLEEIGEAPDRQRLIYAYQDAWIIACLRNFYGRGISCMSQIPQAIFHSQLPTNRTRVPVRNSDDFFPNVPSSHPWHIWANAHNTLFTSYLNNLPDWDMFQTNHEYAWFHAAARCISGGPIYITDEPGKHNISLIRQITALDAFGNTIILRPNIMGKTIEAFTAYEEEHLLRVGSFAGGKGGTGILGLFNVSSRTLSELVHLRDFPGIENDRPYILRAHQTGHISAPLGLSSGVPLVASEIDPKDWEILTASPVQRVRYSQYSDSTTTFLSVLGLIDKMTGPAAILEWSAAAQGHGRCQLNVALKALGRLGIYISDIRDKNVEKNLLVLVQGFVIPANCVSIANTQSLLEVDLEKAWKHIWEVNKRPEAMGADIRVKILLQE